MKRLTLIIVLALVSAVLVACGPAVVRPETVAVVNGEDISLEKLDARLDQARAEYAYYGIDLDGDQELLRAVQTQVLDALINETLMFQYAADQGITASQEDIDAQYAQLVEQFQGEEALGEALEAQGMDRDQLMALIAEEIVLMELLHQEREALGLAVTEEELREAYQWYEDMGYDMPPFDEARPMLEEDVEHEQLMQVYQDLIEYLRQEAEIDIRL